MDREISRLDVHYGPGLTRGSAKMTYRSVSYVDDPRWGQIMADLRPEEVTGAIVHFKRPDGSRYCRYEPRA